MSIQSACDASNPVTREFLAQEFRRPKCPRCGSVLLIAEESAFNLRVASGTPGRATFVRTSS